MPRDSTEGRVSWFFFGNTHGIVYCVPAVFAARIWFDAEVFEMPVNGGFGFATEHVHYVFEAYCFGGFEADVSVGGRIAGVLSGYITITMNLLFSMLAQKLLPITAKARRICLPI